MTKKFCDLLQDHSVRIIGIDSSYPLLGSEANTALSTPVDKVGENAA